MRKYIDKHQVFDYWSELEYSVYRESWEEFSNGRRTKTGQSWNLIPSGPFIKLVRKAFLGTLNDEDKKLIDEYQEILWYNWCKLDFNTKMVGHSPYDPIDLMEEYNLIPSFWSSRKKKAAERAYSDWVAWDAFSDFGLQPIGELLIPLTLQQNYSIKMQIMAEIIGITHMRGDLSAFFIEGGRYTEQQIDVYEPSYECAGY
jgi:hypothetical protein